MRINNNVTANNTHRQLNLNNISSAKITEKLSSGFRINRAADDAAGLTISEKMRAQIKGLNRASMNAQDGVSLLQSAESALNEYSAILQRIRELAVQGSNDSINSADEYNAIGEEMNALFSELDRIVNVTQFNGKTLFGPDDSDIGLKGDLDSVLDGNYFHVGSNSANAAGTNVDTSHEGNAIAMINLDDFSLALASQEISDTLGIVYDPEGFGGDADFSAISQGHQEMIDKIDIAISDISTKRSQLGALQNRLESTIRNLDTISENLGASESRIRDLDMAKAMTEFTRNNIMQQASTAMLAQANQAPQTVLQLLR